MTSTERISADHDPFVQIDALITLVDQAAPIMMKLAYDGGSMFAKDWLNRAKEFGIDALE